MKILIIVLVIVNTFLIPLVGSESNIDTSEDILTEGISDPTYITEEK